MRFFAFHPPLESKLSRAPEKQKTRNFRCGFSFAEKEGQIQKLEKSISKGLNEDEKRGDTELDTFIF